MAVAGGALSGLGAAVACGGGDKSEQAFERNDFESELWIFLSKFVATSLSNVAFDGFGTYSFIHGPKIQCPFWEGLLSI